MLLDEMGLQLNLFILYLQVICLFTIFSCSNFGCRIMNPLIFGDYPSVMKKAAGTRIPTFSKYEAKLVKGSVDFIGLNHYRTASVKDRSSSIEKNTRDFGADIEADISRTKSSAF